MADELVLRIDPDGSLTALSGSGIEEALDLRAFGKMEAQRAGRIEFDSVTQTWGWFEVGGGQFKWGFRTRREAVVDEIVTMQATL